MMRRALSQVVRAATPAVRAPHVFRAPVLSAVRGFSSSSILDGSVNTASDDFKQNQAAMDGLVEELRSRIEVIKQGGGEKSCERHLARDKLLPRDRIDRLLDP